MQVERLPHRDTDPSNYVNHYLHYRHQLLLEMLNPAHVHACHMGYNQMTNQPDGAQLR